MQAQMTIRICDTCKKPLNFKPDGTQEGIYCGGEYYHEGDCIEDIFAGTTDTWESHYANQGEDGEDYFTEWAPEITPVNA